MMKILLVTLTRHDEPLGIMYLSQVLKNHGHDVRGVMIEKEDLFKAVNEFNPALICYSAMTCEKIKTLSINSMLKRRYDFFSIVGGPLATFSPDIVNNKDIDAVCIGEGEDAIVELADALDKKTDIRKIKNVWVRIDGKIFRNNVRPFSKNIDSIAFPDRQIFKRFKSDRLYNLITSRGCMFDCSYCHNKGYKALYKGKGPIIRYRSIDNLIEELKEVAEKFSPSIFWFQEDHFYTDLKILKKFTKKYNAKINIPFICSLRPEFLTNEERVRILKEANCKSVFTGCEAGNDKIRKMILKRNISKEQIIRACDLLHKHRIDFVLQNMIGIPTSSFKDDIETLELNIRCRPYYAWASICSPYPGTELFAIAKRAGLIKKDYYNKLSESYHIKTPLKITHAHKVNILHKVFALITEYPFLLLLIKKSDFYNIIKENEIKELKVIFDNFKKYKYDKLYIVLFLSFSLMLSMVRLNIRIV